MRRVALFALLALASTACDRKLPPGLYADALVADSALAARTKKMLFVVREMSTVGCDALWTDGMVGIAESSCNGPFPEVDATQFFVPVSLPQYPALDVFLYAYEDTACGPIAGGCVRADLNGAQRDDAIVVTVPIAERAMAAACPEDHPIGSEVCRGPPDL